MESEPLDEVQWRSPEWIQQNNGLRTDNVLEYFSYSPFYDRGSNNQILKMQSQFQQPPGPGAPPHHAAQQQQQQLYAELRNMKGTEFVVAIAREPEMWVIRKQTRLSPQETRPLSTYFVVGENIYMAPSVHSVVSSRLLSTTLALTRALAKASRLHGFSPSQGYFYKNDPAAAPGGYSHNNVSGGINGAAAGNIGSGAGRNASRQVTPGTTPAASSGSTGNNTSTALLNTNMERIAFSAIDRALGFTMSGTPSYIDDAPGGGSSNGVGGSGGVGGIGNGSNPSAVVGGGGVGGAVNGTTGAAAASGTGTGVNTAVGTPVSTPGPGGTKPNPRRRKKLHG